MQHCRFGRALRKFPAKFRAASPPDQGVAAVAWKAPERRWLTQAKLDFRSQLASIKVPFLVVAGRHGGIVLPRLSSQFKKYAPQAKFVMFERSGHYPFIEDESAVHQDTGRFSEVVEFATAMSPFNIFGACT
jgi:pimeloyl-ACP methyl ester carboxylesterase